MLWWGVGHTISLSKLTKGRSMIPDYSEDNITSAMASPATLNIA